MILIVVFVCTVVLCALIAALAYQRGKRHGLRFNTPRPSTNVNPIFETTTERSNTSVDAAVSYNEQPEYEQPVSNQHDHHLYDELVGPSTRPQNMVILDDALHVKTGRGRGVLDDYLYVSDS